MKRKATVLQSAVVAIAFLALSLTAIAQTESPCDYRSTYLYWVGADNADFFDENNWRIANRKLEATGGEGAACNPGEVPKFMICRGHYYNPESDKIPKAGTIDPAVALPFNLLVDSAKITINAPLVFTCIDKGITLNATEMVANASIAGTVHMEHASTLRANAASATQAMRISLTDQGSWVYYSQVNPVALAALPLSNFLINLNIPASADALLYNQYYQTGTVLRRNPNGFEALKLFSASNLGGSSAMAQNDSIYKGSAIPGGLDANIRSFTLKRGFMVTLAVNTNGTGKSKVYIASEEDLVVNDLPLALSGNVRFVRVLPFNWVTKKGTGGYFENNPLNAGWFYNWGAGQNTQLNYEYVPMAWGAGSTAPTALSAVVGKDKVNQLLGFNEPDDCGAQSGQFLNLCQPEVAVAYYERLMGTGLRLGSPAGREQAPNGWLKQFNALAKARDVRFDFVAVHWYDWGSNPATSPNADAESIFNRFKSYLDKVHNDYQLPIWITEFNANPNRGTETQQAFLALALPYLESLSYVERYAYFQPDPRNATVPGTPGYYFSVKDDPTSPLTIIGQTYLNHPSTPSIPGPTYACPNNLEGMDMQLPIIERQQLVFEAECGSYPGSKWTIGEDGGASNGKFLPGNSEAAGTTDFSTEVHFEFNAPEAVNYRIWLRTKQNAGIAVVQVDHNRTDTIRSITNAEWAWQSVPRLYSFTAGKHTISLAFANNTTQFDQIAIIAGSDDPEGTRQPAGTCTPADFVWGLDEPAPVFAEGEAATMGLAWSVKPDADAVGDAFAGSGISTSVATPPGTDGWLTFTVNVTIAAAYQFFTKMQALEASATSLWIKIGDDDFAAWNALNAPGYLWKWVRYDAGAQQQYLFLTPGSYTFTIAYNSGGVKIDRVALVAAGTTPASIDPDVVAPVGVQSFEAEEAQIIGAASIVSCVTSSNGKQVNLFNNANNGVRFNEVLAGTAGNYQLSLHYMSKVQRSMRVFVNGALQPVQRMTATGNWCYEGGAPGVWYMSVALVAGINVIELRPVSSLDAPFVDRIDVQPVLLSMEAELAQLNGGVAVSNCTNASNGAAVNLGNVNSNAVTFNNVTVGEEAEYQLNISYVSAIARSLRFSIDGGAFTTLSFPVSGNWCFDNGAPVVKKHIIHLGAGSHTIRFSPVSGDAPFLDKIELVTLDVASAMMVMEERTTEPVISARNSQVVNNKIYPNPARPGSTIYLPYEPQEKDMPAQIKLMSCRGNTLQQNRQALNAAYRLPLLSPGVYFIRTQFNGIVNTHKILIQY